MGSGLGGAWEGPRPGWGGGGGRRPGPGSGRAAPRGPRGRRLRGGGAALARARVLEPGWPARGAGGGGTVVSVRGSGRGRVWGRDPAPRDAPGPEWGAGWGRGRSAFPAGSWGCGRRAWDAPPQVPCAGGIRAGRWTFSLQMPYFGLKDGWCRVSGRNVSVSGPALPGVSWGTGARLNRSNFKPEAPGRSRPVSAAGAMRQEGLHLGFRGPFAGGRRRRAVDGDLPGRRGGWV